MFIFNKLLESNRKSHESCRLVSRVIIHVGALAWQSLNWCEKYLMFKCKLMQAEIRPGLMGCVWVLLRLRLTPAHVGQTKIFIFIAFFSKIMCQDFISSVLDWKYVENPESFQENNNFRLSKHISPSRPILQLMYLLWESIPPKHVQKSITTPCLILCLTEVGLFATIWWGVLINDSKIYNHLSCGKVTQKTMIRCYIHFSNMSGL